MTISNKLTILRIILVPVFVALMMLEMGLADENTRFICHHFSHNGYNVVYDEFVPIAAKEGFLVSYDGMILHI